MALNSKRKKIKMKKSIKLTLDGREYTAVFNDNQTVADIIDMMPMELILQRYAGHEYYSELPKKPSVKEVPMTSVAHAGDICYFDGWNAFTVLFGDAYIDPFKVVLVGHVNEDILPLAEAGDMVAAKIEVIL